jgi:DNA-binding transcriptional MocR family regulator
MTKCYCCLQQAFEPLIVHTVLCPAALLARSKPSMISLAGGNPNPGLFPFKEMDIKLRSVLVLFALLVFGLSQNSIAKV